MNTVVYSWLMCWNSKSTTKFFFKTDCFTTILQKEKCSNKERKEPNTWSLMQYIFDITWHKTQKSLPSLRQPWSFIIFFPSASPEQGETMAATVREKESYTPLCSQCSLHIICGCAYFLGPSGSSTISSSSLTSSSTLFKFSKPSTLISETSVSFLGVFSFSFLSFCLGGALRFGFGTSLENKDSKN